VTVNQIHSVVAEFLQIFMLPH